MWVGWDGEGEEEGDRGGGMGSPNTCFCKHEEPHPTRHTYPKRARAALICKGIAEVDMESSYRRGE